MTLKDYLIKNKITYREFAKKTGYTLLHIHNYLQRKSRITRRTATAFSVATDGECSVKDLLEWNPIKNINKEIKDEESINSNTINNS